MRLINFVRRLVVYVTGNLKGGGLFYWVFGSFKQPFRMELDQ
jgi:hypothetical protein